MAAVMFLYCEQCIITYMKCYTKSNMRKMHLILVENNQDNPGNVENTCRGGTENWLPYEPAEMSCLPHYALWDIIAAVFQLFDNIRPTTAKCKWYKEAWDHKSNFADRLCVWGIGNLACVKKLEIASMLTACVRGDLAAAALSIHADRCVCDCRSRRRSSSSRTVILPLISATWDLPRRFIASLSCVFLQLRRSTDPSPTSYSWPTTVSAHRQTHL